MSYESVVLADSPAMLWMLQETSGTSAADATGNGHTGTYTGTYTQGASGPSGVAALALSVSGAGYVTQSASLGTPGSISIELWAKTSTAGNGLFAGYSSNFVCYMTTDGKLWAGLWTGSAAVTITSPGTYNDGAWHYIVTTYDSAAQTFNLYVDGSRVAQLTSASTPPTGSAGDNCGYSINTFGSWPGTSSSNDWTGSLCAYAHYTTALSASKVAAHYAAASAPAAVPYLISQSSGYF